MARLTCDNARVRRDCRRSSPPSRWPSRRKGAERRRTRSSRSRATSAPGTTTTSSTPGRRGSCSTGTEVKSLRDGRANISDAYGIIRDGEVFLLNLHISPYERGGYTNHEPDRTRKLLLHRKEIRRLIGAVERQGLTLIPLELYFKNGSGEGGAGARQGKEAARQARDRADARRRARDGARGRARDDRVRSLVAFQLAAATPALVVRDAHARRSRAAASAANGPMLRPEALGADAAGRRPPRLGVGVHARRLGRAHCSRGRRRHRARRRRRASARDARRRSAGRAPSCRSNSSRTYFRTSCRTRAGTPTRRSSWCSRRGSGARRSARAASRSDAGERRARDQRVGRRRDRRRRLPPVPRRSTAGARSSSTPATAASTTA